MAFVVLSFLLFSCSTTRHPVPSRIGLLPLDAYNYSGSNLEADTVFRVFRNETVFNATFAATNTAARRPAFQGQTVVAIIMKSAPVTPLHFSRAEVAGKVINIYAQPCTGCSSSRVVMATIPNVNDARSVQFFINEESKARLEL